MIFATIPSMAVISPAIRAIRTVSPPFDCVPASELAYQTRLTDIARQIIENLLSPAASPRQPDNQ